MLSHLLRGNYGFGKEGKVRRHYPALGKYPGTQDNPTDGRAGSFGQGSIVEIEITERGLFVKPTVKKRGRLELPYSEAELVRGLTPAKAHADGLPTPIPGEAGD